MKFEEIVMFNRLPKVGEAFVGGMCNLAEAIPWPLDSKQRPCMHLMTLPCSFFDKKNSHLFLSVFIPYADDLYYKDLRGSFEENASAVIIHDNSGQERNEFNDPSVKSRATAMGVEIRDEDDEPDICGSKIFHVPGWLQDEELIEGYSCKLSVYGNDFSAAFEETRGLFSDGVVFIFVKDTYQIETYGSIVGKLIWQL
jgi:hypothetical protein